MIEQKKKAKKAKIIEQGKRFFILYKLLIVLCDDNKQ